MAFNLLTLPHWSAHPASFPKRFTCNPSTDEREQIVKAVNRAKGNQCRIHVLMNDKESYGFIALSLTTVGKDKLPTLVLEYLFVSQQYRGHNYGELQGLKIGDWLIAEALQFAQEITTTVPLRYVGLEPASDPLGAFYQRRGFLKIDRTSWLYAVVPKPQRAEINDRIDNVP